ncbi:hypothetical protein H7R52_18125 [Weissella confusa]|uniref:Uncharacterized protein n=1 Tax=Weissella confusa TaxID=1583 RepID=A0A923NFR1_WEICO|nr:hypothetical protein [Weissella confusa]
MATTLSIMPFGGVRENGKNMYAVTVGEDINFFAKLLLIEIVPPIILTVINIIITKSIGKESIEMQTRFVISSFVAFWATPILIVILGRKVSEILQQKLNAKLNHL